MRVSANFIESTIFCVKVAICAMSVLRDRFPDNVLFMKIAAITSPEFLEFMYQSDNTSISCKQFYSNHMTSIFQAAATGLS